MRLAVLEQVLGDGRIRTVAEQQRHLAPAPRTSRTQRGTAPPINSDFDLYALMTPDQRRRLVRLADDLGMTPAEFAIDALVRHRIIPGKAINRTGRRDDDRPTAAP